MDRRVRGDVEERALWEEIREKFAADAGMRLLRSTGITVNGGCGMKRDDISGYCAERCVDALSCAETCMERIREFTGPEALEPMRARLSDAEMAELADLLEHVKIRYGKSGVFLDWEEDRGCIEGEVRTASCSSQFWWRTLTGTRG